MSSDRSTPNAWPDRENMVRVIAEQKGVITNIAGGWVSAAREARRAWVCRSGTVQILDNWDVP